MGLCGKVETDPKDVKTGSGHATVSASTDPKDNKENKDVEAAPDEMLYTSGAVKFLEGFYWSSVTLWQRDSTVDLGEALTKLMTGPSDDALLAMGIGFRESNFLNIIGSKMKRLRSEVENSFSKTQKALQAMRDLGRDNPGKGYCQFVSAWLAKYLIAAAAINTGMHDISNELGNHAFTYVAEKDKTFIIDGTWRQFTGVLGIQNKRDLPVVLVAEVNELEAVLRKFGANTNSQKAQSLIAFYKKYSFSKKLDKKDH